jgi:hypothetical protein
VRCKSVQPLVSHRRSLRPSDDHTTDSLTARTTSMSHVRVLSDSRPTKVQDCQLPGPGRIARWRAENHQSSTTRRGPGWETGDGERAGDRSLGPPDSERSEPYRSRLDRLGILIAQCLLCARALQLSVIGRLPSKVKNYLPIALHCNDRMNDAWIGLESGNHRLCFACVVSRHPSRPFDQRP